MYERFKYSLPVVLILSCRLQLQTIVKPRSFLFRLLNLKYILSEHEVAVKTICIL